MPIRCAKPVIGDAAAIWALASDSGALDVNSPYFYLTFCNQFADTSIVAKSDSGVVGFIAGMRPPDQADTLFVWQIAVSPTHRGRGVAHEMLCTLLGRLADNGVRYLEATVTPANEASQRMFRSFAGRLGAACEESLLYSADMFPKGRHEDEWLLRIGPISAAAMRSDQEKRDAKALAE